MATFTVPTFDVPYDSPLGRHGLSFPRSYTVVIASGVATPFPGANGLVDPDDMGDVADAGSGVGGKAIFRFGKTYTVTTDEQTALETAGYTVDE